jgi:putative oxidoreductase
MNPSVQTQNTLTLIGRVLLALLFVPAGFGKIAGFTGTAGYIASVGLPLPQVGVVVAILIEFGLGLLLLVGFKTRWAALILALFSVVSAIFFHNFWAAPADQMGMQQINFYKNMAIAGGLLFVVAFGAGALSIDGRTRKA